MKIIIVNGYPESGKTQFGKFCKEIYKARCEERSSIDKVKEIAKTCGWNGEKDPDSRRFLSDLKDLLTSYNDLPLNDIKKHIQMFENELRRFGLDVNNSIFLTDIREPEEIEKAKNKLNAVTVFINRNSTAEHIQSNHADSRVEDYIYDYYIENNGTLEEFRTATETFLKEIFES